MILGAVVNFIFSLKDGANSESQTNLDWNKQRPCLDPLL